MISLPLLWACLLWAGGALLVFELVWYFVEKKLNLLGKLPVELKEAVSSGYFFSRFLMNLAFLVILPAVVYGWFYVLVPFYGTRSGVALAILVFILGIVPFTATIMFRIRLPMSFMLFQMAGHLLKLILVYGVISYLYIL